MKPCSPLSCDSGDTVLGASRGCTVHTTRPELLNSDTGSEMVFLGMRVSGVGPPPWYEQERDLFSVLRRVALQRGLPGAPW